MSPVRRRVVHFKRVKRGIDGSAPHPCSGFLCRAVYEIELASIATLWAASSTPGSPIPPPETVKWLTDRFVHALRFFSFFPSTPSSVVARELEAAFFSCVSRSKGVPFLTELGVKEASAVRMPQPAVASFIKQVRQRS
jgi:hypothetical protein